MEDFQMSDNQIFQTLLGLRPPSPSARPMDDERHLKVGRTMTPNEKLQHNHSSAMSTSAVTATTANSSAWSGGGSGGGIGDGAFGLNQHIHHQHFMFQHHQQPVNNNNNNFDINNQQHQQGASGNESVASMHSQSVHSHQQQQQFSWNGGGVQTNNFTNQQQQQQQQQHHGMMSPVASAPTPINMSSNVVQTGDPYTNNNNNGMTMMPVGPVGSPTDRDVVDQAFLDDFHKNAVLLDNPPPENPRAEDVDKITAVSLNELSMESREQVLYDLHGIRKDASGGETAEYLQTKLQALEVAIRHTKDKSAYDLAVTIDPKYVSNPAFRIKFLRAESFDVPRTAIRYVKHFQAKLELFDATLLCKDITQDDLEQFHNSTKAASSSSMMGDGMDMASDAGSVQQQQQQQDNNNGPCPAIRSLYSGWIQEFPVRDVAGRLCSVISQQMLDPNIPVEDLLRSIFYRRMVNSEDPETQLKGVVLIMYKSAKSFDRVLIWKIGRLLSSLPIRFMAYHMCFDSVEYSRISPIIALGRMAVNVFDRHRFRVHQGSTTDLNYNLQTFGIPVGSMPIDENGATTNDHDQKFWLNRLAMERQRLSAPQSSDPVSSGAVTSPADAMDASLHVATPGNNDVLLGRGKSFQDHAGNVRFRYLIEQHHSDYETAIKNEKTAVALKILGLVHERGGRFLTASELGWVEVDEVSAREKIASCFRSYRKVKYPARYRKQSGRMS